MANLIFQLFAPGEAVYVNKKATVPEPVAHGCLRQVEVADEGA